ncbi:hypothetical protein A3465_19925 [Enterobacter roggenkampii]|nr:hypothetical protein A3465_19925 [Enterobacter roggenkampii]
MGRVDQRAEHVKQRAGFQLLTNRHCVAETGVILRRKQEALAGGTPEENRDILTRLLQGKGEVAHEAAVAANVAMLMRLHGEEDLKANVQKVLDVLRSGAAYDRVTALAARG